MRVEEHSTSQTVPILSSLVSHTQHEIKYATVWKHLMQTHERCSVLQSERQWSLTGQRL